MRPWLVLSVLVALAPREALAQASPPEGCFCLRHVASHQILRGCSGFKPEKSFFGRARCTNEKGQVTDTLMTEHWDVVADGEPDCVPCQPQEREPFEGPRGDDDKPNGSAR